MVAVLTSLIYDAILGNLLSGEIHRHPDLVQILHFGFQVVELKCNSAAVQYHI